MENIYSCLDCYEVFRSTKEEPDCPNCGDDCMAQHIDIELVIGVLTTEEKKALIKELEVYCATS